MKLMRHIYHRIWSFFINGLLTLLPIMLTVALFSFTFRTLNRWFEPIYHLEPEWMQQIPGSQTIVVLLFIFLVGFLINVFFLEPMVHALEDIVRKIPLLKQVYGGIAQLVKAFTVKDESTFQKVVLIPFGCPGNYSIGFMTSQVPASMLDHHEIFYNVFVPATPNPTSGFLMQVAAKDIKVIDLTRQEAMSLIISGGIIKPDRFS